MPMAKALDIQAHYLMVTHLAKPTISHFCILGSKGPKNIYILVHLFRWNGQINSNGMSCTKKFYLGEGKKEKK